MQILQIILNLLSFVIFAVGVILFFTLKKSGSSTRRLLLLTGFTVFAVFLLEIAEGFAETSSFQPNALISTMQVFSLDADFSSALAPFELYGTVPMNTVARIYRIVLYSVAPIAGGAVIYDVLAGISPELLMLLSRRRKLYVFSELNEKSVCLAEDIRRGIHARDTAIVFTGTRFGSSADEEAEIVNRAKELNAIILPDEISRCRVFSKSKQCSFFLMSDESESDFDDAENLAVFRSLLMDEPRLWNVKTGCRIYFFTNSKTAVENVRSIKENFDRDFSDISEKAVLHVIRDFARVTCSMLSSHPLYDALEPTDGSHNSVQPLRVLIFGNNRLSREMFLNSFWCGQVLDHPLQLSVAYLPQKAGGKIPEMAQWLNKLNPEITESCTPRSEILRIRPGDCFSDIYASLGFYEEDIRHTGMNSLLTVPRCFTYGSKESVALKDYDYFIVMDGDDRENASLADNLCRELQYLSSSGLSGGRKIIAVEIENDSLSEILNLRYKSIRESNSGCFTPEMFAFGSLAERFSTKEIMPETGGSSSGNGIHSVAAFDATKDDIYNDFSRAARDYHLQYKLFSAGFSLPSGQEDCSCEEKFSASIRAKSGYLEAIKDNTVLYYRLTLLEHRRWAAFIRTQRFRCNPGLYKLLDSVLSGTQINADREELVRLSYKNVYSYFHPCLVECALAEESMVPDRLDAVVALRSMVKKDESSSGKFPDVSDPLRLLSGVKLSDAPDGGGKPVFSRDEIYFSHTGLLLSEDSSSSDVKWDALLQAHPEILLHEDAKHRGYYCSEALGICCKE